MSIYGYFKERFYRLLAIDHRSMPRLPGYLFSQLKLFLYSVKKYYNDRGFQRSATLAYSMLLSLLPMMVIFILALNAFGGLEDIKAHLVDRIIAGNLPESFARQLADHLTQGADGLIKQISKDTTLYVFIGFLGFVITVVFFFNAVEGNMNGIWNVRRARGIISRFKNFWCMATLLPIFVFLSYYISLAIPPAAWLQAFIKLFLPFIFSILAFFLLYLLMPYARVRADAALKGAIFSGIVWELMKKWFNSYVAQSVGVETKQIAYGTLWLIPIFLIWLYFTWVIILIGLEISFCNQNFDFIDSAHLGRGSEEGFSKEYLAVGLVASVSEAFQAGREPPRFHRVAKALGVPEYYLFDVAAELEKAKLIDPSSDGALSYRPARPPEKMTLAEVVSAVRGESLTVPPSAEGTLAGKVRELFAGARTATDERLQSVTIKDLLA